MSWSLQQLYDQGYYSHTMRSMQDEAVAIDNLRFLARWYLKSLGIIKLFPLCAVPLQSPKTSETTSGLEPLTCSFRVTKWRCRAMQRIAKAVQLRRFLFCA